MDRTSRFVMLLRADGSPVAVQASRVLFIAKGENVTILNFGASTQLNVRGDFDEVLAALDSADSDDD